MTGYMTGYSESDMQMMLPSPIWGWC
eukprot:COSAG01_NODE_60094_length_296_cov_1.187817_1_plen_25_part_01